jgi:O-antigen/teichoic acid export membrane protein
MVSDGLTKRSHDGFAVPALRKWSGRLLIVSLAPIITFGSRFGRNVILSRLLVPDEFGTALAISVMLGLAGLVTDVALDRFVMVNESPMALSTANALYALRGFLVAAISIIAAPALATVFGVPQYWQSFAMAAGLSALGAFSHLGIKQIQRNYDYVPETIAQLAANISAIVVLFPAIAVLKDHRAIIVSYAFEIGIYLICSQILAPSRYSLRWETPILRQALAFGLPLTINGIGLAVISQLDRTLVGYWLGVRELATYAVVLSMSVIPTNLIIGICANLGLSYLLAAGDDVSSRFERYRILVRLYAFVTLAYTVWMVLTLDILTPLIFGRVFTVSVPLHLILTIIAFLRLQRSGAPTTALLATGKTKRLAFINLSAGLGLVAAWIGLTLYPNIESMLIGIMLGELLALVLCFWLTLRAFNRSSQLVSDLLITLIGPTLVVLLLAWFPEPTLSNRLLLLGGGIVVMAVQFFFELRRNWATFFPA